jgi:hypothetical protein
MAAATGSATASAGDRASGAVRLAPSTGGYYNPVAPSTQTARLLTVLVEFNPNANDDVSGFERAAAIGSAECVTERPGSSTPTATRSTARSRTSRSGSSSRSAGSPATTAGW